MAAQGGLGRRPIFKMKRFIYAFKGILTTFKTQLNFRLHLLAVLSVTIAGFLFKLNPAEWALILLAIGLVLALELVDTAIESLVDIISPDYNEKAGRIKDIAAGAVLIAAIISVFIGLIVFLPKIIALF